MDQELFRRIVEEQLLPLFSDATISGITESSVRHEIAASSTNPTEYFVKPDRNADWRLIVSRPQPFSSNERALFKSFMSTFSAMAEGLEAPYGNYLKDALSSTVVAQSVSPLHPQAVSDAIHSLFSWSSQTYEGNAVSFGVGFKQGAQSSNLSLSDCWNLDAFKVAADGSETLAVCNHDGYLTCIEKLNEPQEETGIKSPYAFRKVANWARNGRAALVLTRNRDILVFEGGLLRFAWRRGSWHHIPSERIIKQMGGLGQVGVRDAIYETVLDVSFARCGGCIGLCVTQHMANADRVIPPTDRIDSMPTNPGEKVRLMYSSVGGKLFQDLPRALRRQLASVDGAIVLAPSGQVLCAGTIVKVTKGSETGSRRAAALAISNLGLGIKVSADGPVTGFRNGKAVFTVFDSH